jgi:hypothetical protein
MRLRFAHRAHHRTARTGDASEVERTSGVTRDVLSAVADVLTRSQSE